MARFSGFSGADFGAAPLEKPPPWPSSEPRFYSRCWQIAAAGPGPQLGDANWAPSPPGGRRRKVKALHQYFPFSSFASLSPSLIPWFAYTFCTEFLDFPEFHFITFLAPTWIAPENSRSWRVLANADRGDCLVRIPKRFCRSFDLFGKDGIASKIIARDPF